MGHRNTLRTKTAQKAAHAYSPQQHSAGLSPVLVTTGANDGTGRLRLAVEDILRLKTAFDDMDYPDDKRYFVLNSLHVQDLILWDIKTFGEITDYVNGKPKRFAGFNMLQFTKNPIYDFTTKQKMAFGTAPSLPTHVVSSFSFYSDEVMKSDGDVQMYSTINDPKERATIVGFDKRFVAMPLRNKGVASIISGLAA